MTLREPISAAHDVAIPIIVNLVSTGIVVVLAYMRRSVARFFERRAKRLYWLPLASASLFSLCGASAALILARRDVPLWLVAGLLLAGIGALEWALLAELRGFWRAGFRRIDSAVASGIAYDDSLRLVHTEIAFLGTGASKLTTQDSFKGALRRCGSANGDIRFLLSKPDAVGLAAAAKRAERDAHEYSRTVTKSLHVLAELNRHAGVDVQVRFYTGESAFRLMFIDDRLCLVGYNVYGGAEASTFPQAHVVNVPDATRSYYWAFRKHFELTWKSSEPWNPEDYLS